jgi:sugar lactone lactonase YvrE
MMAIVGRRFTTSSATLLTVNGLAFDAAGTLWVASADDSLLLAFSAEALGASGPGVASRVIAPVDRSLSAPAAIAFDGLQRLWVANFVAGTLVRFDPAQLAAGGAPTPAVTLRGLSRPTALAFDESGSLWVASAHTNLVVKYSAAQLDVSGAPIPEVVLSGFGSALSNPFALAFDAFGTLWVTNVGKGTIVGFGSQKLEAAGSPAPDVELSTSTFPFGIPIGLAFDGEGNLWVVSGEGALLELTRTQLAASGAPEPGAAIRGRSHPAQRVGLLA